MTQRFHALTVVLEESAREDDLQHLINAIAQMRNVLKVVPAVESGMVEYVAKQRVLSELKTKLWKALED